MFTILASFFVVVLSYLIWRRRDSKLPPGPRGVPILGALPFIGRNPGKRFREWSEKYGEIFSVRMGDRDFVVLNNYELIEEVCVGQSSKVMAKPILYVVDRLRNGQGILFANPGVWKAQRPFVAHSLRRLGKNALEARVEEEAFGLIQAIKEKDGAPFDIKSLAFLASANVIFAVTVGERYDYDSEEFQDFIHLATKSLQDPFDGPMIMLMLYCKWLYLVPPFRGVAARGRKSYENVCEFFRKKIAEHESSFDKNEIRDMTDAFLKQMKQDGHDETFNRRQLEVLNIDFVDAGTQTTSTTLTWCVLALLRFPKWQKRIRTEIEQVSDMRGKITMASRDHMPQTVAFIHEVMRRCCLVAFSDKETSEELTVAGYEIPKNTPILFNLWSVLSDPRYFENPSEFRPERFISTASGTFTKPKYWIPFSIGKRSCVGDQLAQMEIFHWLVKIIQNFDLKTANEKNLPSLDDGDRGPVYVPKPFDVRFCPVA